MEGHRGVGGSLHPSEPDLGDPGQMHRRTQGLHRRFKQIQEHMDAQTVLYVLTEYYKEQIPPNYGGEKMGWNRGDPQERRSSICSGWEMGV